MSEFLPYGRQAVSEADVAAVVAALHDPLITQGPRVEEFERAFAGATGARHAVAFSSGTAALHGAAVAAGLEPGDDVLTTPVSFVASSNCVLYTGARPRFADIAQRTGNLDIPRAIDSGAADGVKACVAVSLAGLPLPAEHLQALRDRGVVVIEDGCHALGAIRDGRPVGSGPADMTAFSLHPVKAVTTGEGGVITTDRDEYADAMRAFRTHGIRRGTGSDDPLQGPWHYDVETLGFNYRITDFQCALGSSQLGRLSEFIERRNVVARLYRERLESLDGIDLPAEAETGDRHAYHLFVVRFPEGARRRRQVFEDLRASQIGTQLHYIPIYRHSLYRSLGYGPPEIASCVEAERYYEQALSLPMFPGMAEADVERVADALSAALARPLS